MHSGTKPLPEQYFTRKCGPFNQRLFIHCCFRRKIRSVIIPFIAIISLHIFANILKWLVNRNVNDSKMKFSSNLDGGGWIFREMVRLEAAIMADSQKFLNHDDVIKWKHFPRNWPLVRGIHRSPVNSPHKGQWRGALMFSLICVWINGWVNNREAGDFRRYRAHYGVIVMEWLKLIQGSCASGFHVLAPNLPTQSIGIVMMSHESHCVQNHWKLDYLFNILYKLRATKNQGSTLLAFVSPVTSGFPSQQAINVESGIPISLRPFMQQSMSQNIYSVYPWQEPRWNHLKKFSEYIDILMERMTWNLTLHCHCYTVPDNKVPWAH